VSQIVEPEAAKTSPFECWLHVPGHNVIRLDDGSSLRREDEIIDDTPASVDHRTEQASVSNLQEGCPKLFREVHSARFFALRTTGSTSCLLVFRGQHHSEEDPARS
jgi:hypothetical protein